MKAIRTLLLAAILVVSGTPSPAAAAFTTTFDRCLARLTNDVIHFLKKRAQCTRACENAVRNGKLPATMDCGPASSDGPTALCHAKAQERLTGSRATTRRVCQDDEVALFYASSTTCPGENQTLKALAACLQARSAALVDDLLRSVYRPRGSASEAFLDPVPGLIE